MKLFSPPLMALLLVCPLLISCASKQEPKAWTLEARKNEGKIGYHEVSGSLKLAEALIPCASYKVINDEAAQLPISNDCHQLFIDRPKASEPQGFMNFKEVECQKKFEAVNYRILTYRCQSK